MADNEQQTPGEAGSADQTTPIEPVVLADQAPPAPAEPSGATTGRSPWAQRGLIAAGALGLVLVSGVAGYAIGNSSARDARDVAGSSVAQGTPGQDGPGAPERDGDGRGWGGNRDGDGRDMHGDGDWGGRGMHDDHHWGDNDNDNGMPGMPGMPGWGGNGNGNTMPGMGDLPSPEQLQQWLEENGFDMEQFMREFGMPGMGQGMGQGPGQQS